jgi:hypothetical protein
MKTKLKIHLTCLLGAIFLQHASAGAEPDSRPLMERLPPKIQKIQKELPAWIHNAGDKEKATALMQKLKEHLDSKNFEDAEKTADSILKLIGASGQVDAQEKPDDTRKRLSEKLARVREAAQAWADTGRDPSDVLRAMEQRFKPLIDSGKTIEAEAELDRALKVFGQDANGVTPPANPAEAMHQRVAAKVERVKEGVHKLAASGTDPSAILKTMGEKVGPLLDAGKFVEAEVVLDRVLKTLGLDPDARLEPAKPSGTKTKADARSTPLDEAAQKRLPEKIERVKEGMQKWAAGGRDPSAISQTVQEKFKPLLDAGKFAEAEVELDRVLEQLKQDAK